MFLPHILNIFVALEHIKATLQYILSIQQFAISYSHCDVK